MRVLARFFAPSLAWPGEIRQFTKVDFDERGGSPRDKIRTLRGLVDEGAADPRICELASRIALGAPLRDDAAEAQALLSWVQENIRYTEEGTETFRTASYTAEHGYGDCDDSSVLFGALCESIAIPVALQVISKRTGVFRFEPLHVFCLVGLPRRNPLEWVPAETTLPRPLGWDPTVYAIEHADKL